MYSNEPPRPWGEFLNTLNTEAYSHMYKVYSADYKRLQAEQLAAEIEQKNKKKRK